MAPEGVSLSVTEIETGTGGKMITVVINFPSDILHYGVVRGTVDVSSTVTPTAMVNLFD